MTLSTAIAYSNGELITMIISFISSLKIESFLFIFVWYLDI